MRDTYSDLTDLEIISLILEGEINLYEVIVRRYNRYLYKIGRSYGYRHNDVEDLMQETYTNAYTHLSGFENRSSFKTWLVQIMLHQCYKKQHQSSYQKEFPSSEKIGENSLTFFGKKNVDGNKTIDNIELKEVIETAILQMPEDLRMVFTLRELMGLNTAETAHALNITESNAKVRLNRAKKTLQNTIQNSYSTEELFDFHLKHYDKMVKKVMELQK